MNLDGILQAITDLLNTNGVLFERGRKPDSGGWAGAPGQSAFVPYGIVWRIGAKDLRHRDLDGQWDETSPLIHLRTVGGTPSEADQHLDAANTVVSTTSLVVAGLTVVHLVYDTSITTTRDADVAPPVYYTGSYWRWTLQEA